MSSDFLEKAKTSNSLISEHKILEYLANMGKAVVISLDELDYFQQSLLEIKIEIEKAACSDIHHFVVGKNGIESQNIIGKSCINELEFHNLVDRNFKRYSGYCFIVNAGISYMMHGGEIDSSIEGCLLKTKTMQRLLNTKKNVGDLREVFENFYSACKYHKNYHEYCFNSNGMIKAEIKERELRNLLQEYLNENVKGDVQTEFCTDYYNDEESVDIYLNDGIQRAIIEVKFSFKNTYYSGNTYYSFSTRIGDGMKQLDKYAKHLAQGKRQVDFGYVYMFYCNDLSDDEVEQKIQEKYDELKTQLSKDFFSIYKSTITNNLRNWAIS